MEPGKLLENNETITLGVETLVRGEWVKVPERSLVMNRTVWLAKMADPNAQFRYPIESK
jgi:hypothetical protein